MRAADAATRPCAAPGRPVRVPRAGARDPVDGRRPDLLAVGLGAPHAGRCGCRVGCRSRRGPGRQSSVGAQHCGVQPAMRADVVAVLAVVPALDVREVSEVGALSQARDGRDARGSGDAVSTADRVRARGSVVDRRTTGQGVMWHRGVRWEQRETPRAQREPCVPRRSQRPFGHRCVARQARVHARVAAMPSTLTAAGSSTDNVWAVGRPCPVPVGGGARPRHPMRN